MLKTESIKRIREEIRYAPRSVQLLFLCVLLVGLHSISLGIFIYFFTELFYRLFFMAEIENFFFVRQAGLFLFCLGLFNLAILREFQKSMNLVGIIIMTKGLAVLFLASNAHRTIWPPIIYLAALGDGLMAVALFFFYRRVAFLPPKDDPCAPVKS